MSEPIKLLGLAGVTLPAHATGFTLYPADAAGLPAMLKAEGTKIRGIITDTSAPITAALLAQLPKLEIIASASVGFDAIDIAAASAAGVTVTNTPDVLDAEMADFTVGLLLATIRRMPQADRFIRAGLWTPANDFPLTASLRGRRVGIAGMGRIGKAVARRLAGFDVAIAYHGRNHQPALPHDYHADLLALATAVDTLIIILPGGAATRHAVDAAVLAALGPDGILINVARGSVVNEPALIAALQNCTIAAAGIDVFADEPNVPMELRALDNVVLLPHIGTSTHLTRGLMYDLAFRNLQSWFAGGGAITPVK